MRKLRIRTDKQIENQGAKIHIPKASVFNAHAPFHPSLLCFPFCSSSNPNENYTLDNNYSDCE